MDSQLFKDCGRAFTTLPSWKECATICLLMSAPRKNPPIEGRDDQTLPCRQVSLVACQCRTAGPMRMIRKPLAKRRPDSTPMRDNIHTSRTLRKTSTVSMQFLSVQVRIMPSKHSCIHSMPYHAKPYHHAIPCHTLCMQQNT